MNSNQDYYQSSTDSSARKARIHGALTSCALFKSASASTLDAAASAGSLDTVPRGELIVQQGSTSHALALLARGRARVERALISGDVMPLGYRGTGDVAGECALSGGENYTENVVAMDDSDIVRIPTSTMTTILQSDTTVTQALVNLLLQRHAEVEERLTSLLFRPVEGRVVEFLLHAAHRWGVTDGRGTLISAPITHLEIAKVIGSTRETVTLTLGALRREGLLSVAGRRLIVVDRDALAKRR